jgi:hypothetical protein
MNAIKLVDTQKDFRIYAFKGEFLAVEGISLSEETKVAKKAAN